MAAQDLTPNAEGEDLRVPLPKEWDLAALKSMPLKLYSGKISPPSCKIRFLLKYYEVPFTVVNGPKPGSAYRKMPVLDVGDRQINDSFIIVKNLAEILQGRPYTPEELEIEREVTFGLMIAGEKRSLGSTKEVWAFGGLMGGGLGCMMKCSSCLAYGDMLRGQLGSNQFLGGGDQPSVLDVSVFGVLQPFARISAAWVEELLGPPGDALGKWYDSMACSTSKIDIFKA